MTENQEDRWQREAAFFDQKARDERAHGLEIHPKTVERYRMARHAEFPAEYRFIGLGSLRDKTVLDIGCGDGRASVLLALLGARVTGIDISPDAIGAAQARAVVNGVEDRTTFLCTPLEKSDFAPGQFDVIWCDAFLHHVIPDLTMLLTTMSGWLTTGGQIVITEPISLSKSFRSLRLLLLPAPDATPDERPLEAAELSEIRSAFPDGQSRLFGFLSRGARFVLPNGNYERAATWRKVIFRLAAKTDAILFAFGGAFLSSQIVFHGRKREVAKG